MSLFTFIEQTAKIGGQVDRLLPVEFHAAILVLDMYRNQDYRPPTGLSEQFI